MPLIECQKVYGFIIQADRLLVFEEVEDPLVGIEIPGGTVEPYEDLEEAMLREIAEESGLTQTYILRHLAINRYHLTDDEHHICHFFVVGLEGTCPETWQHYEEHSSLGRPPILLRYFWIPLDEAPLRLHPKFSIVAHLLRRE